MGRISELASCVCCLKLSHGGSTTAKDTNTSGNIHIPQESALGEQDVSTGSNAAPQRPPDEPKTQLRGWDKAYNELKQKESDLVDRYEELIDLRPVSDMATSKPGINIEQACLNRRAQMEATAKAAMSRTDKEFRTKSRLDEAMQVVDLARDMGTSVVQNFPQAALPWAGICAALKLFQNPLTESKAQREGMVRVIVRIDWYCALDKQLSEQSSSGLLIELERKMITLFEKLLAFLMRNVCSCFENRLGETLRDTLKLNQWEQALQDIKALEEEFRHDASYESLATMRSDLRELLEFAKEKEFRVLNEMNSSLRELISEKKIERESQCMQALRLGDPKQQKLTIETLKGRQDEDLGGWVRETDAFGAWRNADESNVLWIHGDPGKGKTMLLCEIIDSLQRSILEPDTLLYFFCQATDPKSNTFAAILRGIIYDLAKKRPDLIQHVEDTYRDAGTNIFSEEGSWLNLTEILFKMTDSLAPGTTYFVIDALDECQEDRNLLLRFIVDKALARPNFKLIVSSRNWEDIQKTFEDDRRILSLSLEKNAENVSHALHTFIEARVKDLSKKQGYDAALAEHIKSHLSQGAEGTFLWVSLVCERLNVTHPGAVWARKELAASPPGLTELYDSMMERIMESDDRELGLNILACVVLVYRPIRLQELVICLDVPGQYAAYANTDEDLVSVVTPLSHLCSGFLALRNGFVHFVHQSARDHVLESATTKLFPSGQPEVHRGIFRRCLGRLAGSEALHRDIYNLGASLSPKAYGIDVRAVKKPDPDPLSAISYPCIYWMEHLVISISDQEDHIEDLRDGGMVHRFLERKYVYWLEALSLIEAIPEGFRSVMNLFMVLQRRQPEVRTQQSDLFEFVKDARQFLLFHREAIEQFPLQIYASALLLSPKQSLIKKKFQEDIPGWISLHSSVRDKWDSPILKLPFPDTSGSSSGSSRVHCLVLSHDDKFMTTLCESGMLQLWDRASLRCTKSMNIGRVKTRANIALSNDDQRIAIATAYEVELYLVDVTTWTVHPKINLRTKVWGTVEEVHFSKCSKYLILASECSPEGWFLGRWDIAGKQWQNLPDPKAEILTLGQNGDLYISSSGIDDAHQSFSVRNVATGEVVRTQDSWLPSQDDENEPLRGSFSPDGTFVVRYGEYTDSIDIWNISTGVTIQTVNEAARCVALSHDNRLLAWSSLKFAWNVIEVAEVPSGKRVRAWTLYDTGLVDKLLFSLDCKQLVAKFVKGTVNILDLGDSTEQQDTVIRARDSSAVFISPNEDLVAWRSGEVIGISKLQGSDVKTFSIDTHTRSLKLVHFTPDGQTMSFRDADMFVKVFKVKTLECIRTIQHPAHTHSVSSDGTLVTTVHSGPEETQVVTVWSTSSGDKLNTFQTLCKDEHAVRVSISSNGKYLAFVGDRYFQAWCIQTGQQTCSFEFEETLSYRGEKVHQQHDVDLFHHQDCMTVSSSISAPKIRSLTESQYEKLIRLPVREYYKYPTETRISQDDKLLVMKYEKSELWIWDLIRNTCRQKLKSYELFCPVFHASNLSLVTNIGDIILESDETNVTNEVQPPRFSGISLPVEGHWIAWRGQNVLMLPMGFRPDFPWSSYCRGRLAIIGTNSGQPLVLQFHL